MFHVFQKSETEKQHVMSNPASFRVQAELCTRPERLVSKLLLVLACVPITPIAIGCIALWKRVSKHVRRAEVQAAAGN